MIFGERFSFIHVPKAAGMSMTRFLVNDAKGSMTLFLPPGAIDHAQNMIMESDALPRIEWASGIRHETFDQAIEKAASLGSSLSRSDFVFSISREPIALLRSYYLHLRKKSTIDLRTNFGEKPLKGEQKAAVDGSFEDFLKIGTFYGHAPDACTAYYVSRAEPEINEKMLVVPIEKLNEFVSALVEAGVCYGRTELPFRNVSEYGDNHVTDTLRSAVNSRFASLHELWRKSITEFDTTVTKLSRLTSG